MQKALAVIILGLGLMLLNSCADSSGSRPFGPKPYNVGEILESNEHFIKIVTDKSLMGEYTTYSGSILYGEAIKHCAKYKKYAHYFAWDFDSKGVYFRCYTTKTYKNDEGKKLSWFWESHDPVLYIDSVPQKKTAEIINNPEKKIQMSEMIDKAKNTCKDLGFTPGTDKFADCSLKLYSQRVELAAENKQQIVVQSSDSSSGSMTIYDPVRDNTELIRRGQRMLGGKCTWLECY